MKQRNNSIDAIKGVAILLVMFGHVFVHNHMEDPYVYDFIKAVQMPLFIIISGYLCGQGRTVSNMREYGIVMKKRAIAYMVPFFAWFTVMHLDTLAEAYKIIFVQLDYGLWFLAVLFILTFMVYTAQLVTGMLKAKSSILSELIFWGVYIALALVLVIQIFTGNSILSPYLTIIYVPFYMLGYIIGNYGKKFLCWGTNEQRKLDCKNNCMIQSLAILAFAVFLYLVAAKNLNSMETKIDTLIQMLASVLGCAGIIYGVLQLKEGKLKNIFAKIGGYTLELYVVHYHFANMLNFKDKQYDFYTLEGFVFVMVSFVVMCAVTFCCIWVMKMVKLLNFFFFGKKS